MFSYVYSSAKTYFHLPIDEPETEDVESYPPKCITWDPSHPLALTSGSIPHSPQTFPTNRVMAEVLMHDDLYDILGVSKHSSLDKLSLRQAYLSRSKSCHPDKFPNNPEATHAFQRVAVAYDVLSKPSTKRQYDSRTSNYDVFAARPNDHAQETFRSVVIGVFNDFLDGDLEIIRTLLKTIHDLNPSLSLSDDSVESVLANLQSIRSKALTFRTCIYTLHAELTRLIEVQYALRQLSYFDLIGRTHLTIQLTRITVTLPVALEKALREQDAILRMRGVDPSDLGADSERTILPRHLTLVISGLDVALERMERLVKSS